jgi:hypothetical protein
VACDASTVVVNALLSCVRREYNGRTVQVVSPTDSIYATLISLLGQDQETRDLQQCFDLLSGLWFKVLVVFCLDSFTHIHTNSLCLCFCLCFCFSLFGNVLECMLVTGECV